MEIRKSSIRLKIDNHNDSQKFIGICIIFNTHEITTEYLRQNPLVFITNLYTYFHLIPGVSTCLKYICQKSFKSLLEIGTHKSICNPFDIQYSTCCVLNLKLSISQHNLTPINQYLHSFELLNKQETKSK